MMTVWRLLFPLLLGQMLFGFPPKDLEELKANSERLLASQQYTYLTEYFTSYWKSFALDPKLGPWLNEFCEKISRFDTKQKILASISTTSNTGFNRSRFHYDYALGLNLEGKASEALTVLNKTKEPSKSFLEGEIQWELKNTAAAEQAYLKYLKLGLDMSTQDLRNRSYLRLTEIALFKNDLLSAKKYLLGCEGDSVDKEIYRYRIAVANDTDSEKDLALKRLKKDYSNSIKSQRFLTSVVK